MRFVCSVSPESSSDSLITYSAICTIYLRQRRRYIFSSMRPRSFVCLCARLLKNACIDQMKCCVSTDVGTWTNWLTFEPDPDNSPSGCRNRIPFSHSVCTATRQRGIVLRRKNPMVFGGPSKQQRVVLRRRNTVVGGKCALSSALLVIFVFEWTGSIQFKHVYESNRNAQNRRDFNRLQSPSSSDHGYLSFMQTPRT